jgi:hypothetical protein
MKNSSIINPATNNASKTSKASFADRLAMGEDIDTIVSEDELPTEEPLFDLSVLDESKELPTAATPLQPLETSDSKSLSFKNGERSAQSGTLKAALYACFDSYVLAGIPQENWYEKAKKDNPEILEGRIYKCFRYYTVGEYKRPLDSAVINRTTLTVEQADEKFVEVEKTALEEFETAILKAKKDFCAKVGKAQKLCALAKDNEAKKDLLDRMEVAKSVKKAADVLKTLESIDTSKVEITPDMRAMMLKMLGMETV